MRYDPATLRHASPPNSVQGHASTPAPRGVQSEEPHGIGPDAAGSAPAAELEPLRLFFPSQSTAAELVADMIESNRIYAPFTGRGGAMYEANLAREAYLK